MRYNRDMSGNSKLGFRQAYFVKLGNKGCWEKECIEEHIARIGWGQVPLQEIIDESWNEIEQRIRAVTRDKGAGTRDLQELQRFCRATPGDLWITFHSSRLWWGV